MISITYRITGLMFLVITLAVFLLIYLANQQMSSLFQDYLASLYKHLGAQAVPGGPRRSFCGRFTIR